MAMSGSRWAVPATAIASIGDPLPDDLRAALTQINIGLAVGPAWTAARTVVNLAGALRAALNRGDPRVELAV
jgi:hypothetical protein